MYEILSHLNKLNEINFPFPHKKGKQKLEKVEMEKSFPFFWENILWFTTNVRKNGCGNH